MSRIHLFSVVWLAMAGMTWAEEEALDLGLPPLPGEEPAEVDDDEPSVIDELGDDLELGLPPLSSPGGAGDLDLGLPLLPGESGDGLDLGLPPIGAENPDGTEVSLGDEPSAEAVTEAPEGWSFKFGGYAGWEGTWFPSSPLDPRQTDFDISAVFEPEFEFRHKAQRLTARIVPFGRIDQQDSRRTHVDLREFSLLMEFDEFDILVGASRVFWGTTESAHFVDVINQTDLVENIDQEAKLGQPMVNANFFTEIGRVSFFILPYFRERTFAGAEGRLRTQPRIDGMRSIYESSAERWHPDFALRWSRTFGDLDVGLSYFWGTVREPVYLVSPGPPGETVLLPYYEIVHQPALDITYTWDDWLFKAEAMGRLGQRGGDFMRLAAGFEYTYFGILKSEVDMGVIGEFLYDSGGGNDINPFANDIAYGLRFAFNDLRDTSLLVSLVTDVTDASTFFNVEASRRLGDHWVVNVEARAFAGIPPRDYPLNGYRRDSYLRLGLEYHF